MILRLLHALQRDSGTQEIASFQTVPLSLESLEPRVMLAGISFDAGTGTVLMDGTNGNDTATVTDLGNGQLQVALSGFATQQYSTSSVNLLRFIGKNGNDLLTNNSAVTVYGFGHAGNDELRGGSASDRLYGGPGIDLLFGNAGYDWLFSHDGDDVLYGGSGNDTIYGGSGQDLIWGDGGDDTIYGEAGADTLRGSNGDDWLYGGDQSDLLYGQTGDDWLFGDNGADRLRGGQGVDNAYGGNGNDYIAGDSGDDSLFGNDGSDQINGDDGNDAGRGGNGNDTLNGGNGHDDLFGQGGDDVLNGNNGSDDLYGGDGDDEQYGDQGNDRLYGNPGNDFLRGGDGVDTVRGGSGKDTLFGGDAADADRLIGDQDSDRFLARSNDLVSDLTSSDAQINFVDHTSAWTEAEIEVMDRGFARLHDRTTDARLLNDAFPSGPLTFFKYDDLGGSAGVNYLQWWWNGRNYTYQREIRIADWNENSQWLNDFYERVAVHEIAHNWDSGLEIATVVPDLQGLWQAFEAVSGWTQVNPNDPNNYSQSHDGQWWYLNTASFAEDYGRTNPNEDFATIFEYYFYDYQEPGNHSALLPKLSLLDQLFDAL